MKKFEVGKIYVYENELFKVKEIKNGVMKCSSVRMEVEFVENSTNINGNALILDAKEIKQNEVTDLIYKWDTL